MPRSHHYQIKINWTGNTGSGTSGYTGYDRSHTIAAENKLEIAGSSDPAFRGDKTKYNPEEMFLASLSSCHMLWYLHLCAEAGVVVISYTDNATGTMIENESGGRFTEVTLKPIVTVQQADMIANANELHKKANEHCYIANSVNFPVHHQPVCLAG